MFESVKRVTGTKDGDWNIQYEGAKERFERGGKMMQEGNTMGFGLLLYGRMLYNDGTADMEKRTGLDNDVLGLPKENIDEFTKIAVDKAEEHGGVIGGADRVADPNQK